MEKNERERERKKQGVGKGERENISTFYYEIIENHCIVFTTKLQYAYDDIDLILTNTRRIVINLSA
jgi:hypothetical protein